MHSKDIVATEAGRAICCYKSNLQKGHKRGVCALLLPMPHIPPYVTIVTTINRNRVLRDR